MVRDRIRWLQAAFQHDRRIDAGALTAVAGTGAGFGGLGANTGGSDFPRPDVPGDYRCGRLDFDYRCPLGEQASFRLCTGGQYAVDPLPGVALSSVGGDPYGWAFTGRGIASEKGAAAAIELARPDQARLAAGLAGARFWSLRRCLEQRSQGRHRRCFRLARDWLRWRHRRSRRDGGGRDPVAESRPRGEPGNRRLLRRGMGFRLRSLTLDGSGRP